MPRTSFHNALGFLVLVLAACADRPPAPSNAPTPPTARPSDPPRLSVPRPATVAEALRERLPFIELVPELCASGTRVPMHACVLDAPTGRTRAVRWFGASVSSVREAETLLVAVPYGEQGAPSPYRGAFHRWDLATDTVTREGEQNTRGWYVRLLETGFGPVRELDSGMPGTRIERRVDGAWVEVDSEAPLPLGRVAVHEGVTYERMAMAGPMFATLRLEDGALVRETFAALAPEGVRGRVFAGDVPRPWAAHISTDAARVIIRHAIAPSRDVHENVLSDVGEAPDVHATESAVYVYSATSARRLDLATGRLTALPRAAVPPMGSLESNEPSVIRFGALGLVLSSLRGWVRVGPDGFVLGTPAVAPDASTPRCTCEGAALVCGAQRIDAACAPVDGNVALHRGGPTPADVAQLISDDGRFRVDAVAHDLLRVTRLSDGARLWVRMLGRGALVSADDGAFVVSENVAHFAFSIRAGRSILDAPMFSLAQHRAALERPTLLSDFFADRALPAAELGFVP